jgi:two-component system sensor histidine kinase/response regulator
MVVDDEEFCIEVMKAMLFRAGIDTEHQVDFCISGKEALDQLIYSTNYGLSYKMILTDFSMPVMDGIQATKKMRDYLTEKGKEQPGIIGVTGHVLKEFQ